MQLPYLHWDTRKSFQGRAGWLRDLHDGKDLALRPDLPDTTEEMYLTVAKTNQGASYHPRRSLDQYFYSKLSDTAERETATKLFLSGLKMHQVDRK